MMRSPGSAGRRRRSTSPRSTGGQACPAPLSTATLTPGPPSPTRSPRPGEQRTQILDAQDDEREATWRERALNAEDALKAAHHEITAQRARIGELLGQVPQPAVRMGPGSRPADHHREHHAQAARPHPHRRKPHPRGETQGRTGEPPLPRQAHRRPRSTSSPRRNRPRQRICPATATNAMLRRSQEVIGFAGRGAASLRRTPNRARPGDEFSPRHAS
jgi:hypothetical protein